MITVFVESDAKPLISKLDPWGRRTNTSKFEKEQGSQNML